MTGRSKHAVVGNIFQGGGSGGSSLWVVEVGDDLPHGPVSRDFS